MKESSTAGSKRPPPRPEGAQDDLLGAGPGCGAGRLLKTQANMPHASASAPPSH